jgi:hypothetical protein
MIYRRFGYLHSRVLLYKQDELRQLEEELADMDELDAREARGRKCLANREKDDARTLEGRESRKHLIGRIETKVMEYGEFVV